MTRWPSWPTCTACAPDSPSPRLVRRVVERTRLVEFALTRPDGEQGAANLLAIVDQARTFRRRRRGRAQAVHPPPARLDRAGRGDRDRGHGRRGDRRRRADHDRPRRQGPRVSDRRARQPRPPATKTAPSPFRASRSASCTSGSVPAREARAARPLQDPRLRRRSGRRRSSTSRPSDCACCTSPPPAPATTWCPGRRRHRSKRRGCSASSSETCPEDDRQLVEESQFADLELAAVAQVEPRPGDRRARSTRGVGRARPLARAARAAQTRAARSRARSRSPRAASARTARSPPRSRRSTPRSLIGDGPADPDRRRRPHGDGADHPPRRATTSSRSQTTSARRAAITDDTADVISMCRACLNSPSVRRALAARQLVARGPVRDQPRRQRRSRRAGSADQRPRRPRLPRRRRARRRRLQDRQGRHQETRRAVRARSTTPARARSTRRASLPPPGCRSARSCSSTARPAPKCGSEAGPSWASPRWGEGWRRSTPSE